MIRCLALAAALFVAAPALAQQPLPANLDRQNAIVIDTTQGRVVVRLRPDLAPKHVERIKLLAKEGYYNNVPFHRVISGFMIQGGDPDSKSAQPGQPLGRGGPDYTIPAEFNPKFFHEKGALAAARMGDRIADVQNLQSGQEAF